VSTVRRGRLSDIPHLVEREHAAGQVRTACATVVPAALATRDREQVRCRRCLAVS
jgi:hypothetical protein